jgi:hypothetical protein
VFVSYLERFEVKLASNPDEHIPYPGFSTLS